MSRESKKSYSPHICSSEELTNGVRTQSDIIAYPSPHFTVGDEQYDKRSAPYDNGSAQDGREIQYYSTPRADPQMYPKHTSSTHSLNPHPISQHHRTHSDEVGGIKVYNPLLPSFVHPVSGEPYPQYISTRLRGTDQSPPPRSGQPVFPQYENIDGAMHSRQYNVSKAEPKEEPESNTVKLLNYRPFPPGGEGKEEGEKDVVKDSMDRYTADLDEKIKALYRARKASEGGGRTPKTKGQVLTKEDMESVMNMTPQKNKKKGKSYEAKRPRRSSTTAVGEERSEVGGMGKEEVRRERELQLARRKAEKKLRVEKSASAVELLGYRRVENLNMEPTIPEDAELMDQPIVSSTGIKVSGKEQGYSNPSYLKSSDTVSTTSSFVFHSPFSPLHASTGSSNRPSLSPTQELMEHATLESPNAHEAQQLHTSSAKGVSAQQAGIKSSPESEQRDLGGVVYRQNLDETCIEDVTVFGKHFDPSQLTQDRMVENVGSISSVGLNPTPLLPHKTVGGERAREFEKSPSGSVKSNKKRQERTRSESYASSSLSKKDSKKKEKKEKKERETDKKRGKKEGRSRHHSVTEKDYLPTEQQIANWDRQLLQTVPLPSYATPSRHKMSGFSGSFREPPGLGEVSEGFDQIVKGSLPNLARRSYHSSSSSRSPPKHLKEGTPDSSTSEEDPPVRRRSIGYSLGRKLSASMRELFVAKEKKNPVKRTTWFFAESDIFQENPGGEQQMSTLTERERRKIVEETEITPRMRSVEPEEVDETSVPPKDPAGGNPLAHLFIPPTDLLPRAEEVRYKRDADIAVSGNVAGPFRERSVDGFHEKSVDLPSSMQQNSAAPAIANSDKECESASDGEEDYVSASVNIITSSDVSEDALREAGYATGSTKVGEEEQIQQEGGDDVGGNRLQTSLPTIIERSPPPNRTSEISQLPSPSEVTPVTKSLDETIPPTPETIKTRAEEGKKLKKTPSKPTTIDGAKDANKASKVKKEESKRERKPLFSRFSKPRQPLHRNSPSPRSSSPTTSSLSSDSQPSSGRFSPSKRPVSDPARDTAKTQIGKKGVAGSPRGSFGRGGSHSVSPASSVRGRNSPTTRIPLPKSGGGVRAQPSPGKQSLATKSPTSIMTSRLATQKTESPNLNRRRISAPVSPSRTPLATPKRTGSERMMRVPAPVAPGRTSPGSAQNSPLISTPKQMSRQSSSTSTVTPSSLSSAGSRQRRSGVSLPESPVHVTPIKTFDVQPDVPEPISEEGSSVAGEKETVKDRSDDVGKLLTTVGEKLAPLFLSSETPPLSLSPPPRSRSSQAESSLDEKETTERSSEMSSDRSSGRSSVRSSQRSQRGSRRKSVFSALKNIGGGKKAGKGNVQTEKVKVVSKVTPTADIPVVTVSSSGGSKTKPGDRSLTSLGTSASHKPSPPGSKRWNHTPTTALNPSPSPTTAKKSGLPLTPTPSSYAPKRSAPVAPPKGLPPHPPGSRKPPSQPSTGRSLSTVHPPTIRVPETRSSMRKISVPASGRQSTRGATSKLTPGGNPPLVRSSIRVSSKLKKNNPMSPEHRKISTMTRPGKSDSSPSHSLSRPRSSSRGSMRKVSASPTGGKSAAQLAATQRASVRHGSFSRDTSKKPPSGAGTLKRMDKDRKFSHAGPYASMRVPNTLNANALNRPRTASIGGTLNRNIATRSVRLPSSRKVSALGTMPRPSVVTRPSTTAGSLQTPSQAIRKSFKKSGGTDVFAAFDEISAEAKGQLLTGSDHRRAVRPKFRQKASSSHLKILGDREDVTSEMTSRGPGEAVSGLDPNTYSTYMSKKNLAPSAIAGLATKLDLTTVKLRKTGITEQMLSETAIGGFAQPGMPNPSGGADYDTTHPVLLLQVKGRRQVHTRVVEPSVTSMNSGDVYICVSGKSLFHWIGKSANVIEKARGSDVVMRIIHKKELGCQATTTVVIKEELRDSVGTNKMEKFWELLGGKKGVKSSESVPNDDLYEKAVNMVTMVMQLEGEGEKAHFVTLQENSNQMLKIALLNTKKILLLDFYSEVYLWVGRMSPPKLRKKALELAKKHFDNGCKPPVFTHHGAGGATLVRASGRYRARNSTNTLNRSGRRVSRVKKSAEHSPRPSWTMFNRINEGSEHILFREKFSDWPEQGRIIKMKGQSTGPMLPTTPAELEPADVDKMLKVVPFEGMRLEGDNIHRGQGNYKVSRSSFACNRVHPQKITKWVIKDNANVEVPESDHGLFYVQEAYVLRWLYRITVVKELEGLTPGSGPFARDRKYQREINGKKREVKGASTGKVAKGNDSDTEEEEGERDDESKKMLESGGRDKVAYFFWQGEQCTVNEKGASALMTVELDKERGPQIRVVQGKEHPAFLNLFGGKMILMQGRSETNSLKSPAIPVRMFFVRGQMRSEACLVEIELEHWPLAKFLRSRGCYVIYDIHSCRLYLWKGCKITHALRKVSHTAVRHLKHRLKAELVMVEEGKEPKDMCALIGDRTSYTSLLKEPRHTDFTVRVYELSSTTGQFLASEVLYTGRGGGNEEEAAPILQSDLYTAIQPAIFLIDAYSEVHVWLGWWPQERRDWSIMRETNITTGSAQARWQRDKKLAMETAQLYAKACSSRSPAPQAFLIHAGTEPDEFVHLFPFWKPDMKVQELNCKGKKAVPGKIKVEVELKKYSRTQFSLEELKKKPLPEGVDPSKLETYLSDKDFEAAFRITREKFKQFSSWRQTEIKKRIGLF